MFMCLGLDLVCHAMCYCRPFPFCHIFLCFGLMVRTRSRPYGLCLRPYTLAYIKGFGLFVLASLVLGFAMLDGLSGFVVVWLHLM